MRSSFEKKIELLNAALVRSNEEHARKVRDKDNELAEARHNADLLYKRLEMLSQGSAAS